MTSRKDLIDACVKVDLHSRPLRRWVWTLCHSGTDVPFEQSAELFRYAEDAWQEGKRALSASLNLARSS